MTIRAHLKMLHIPGVSDPEHHHPPDPVSFRLLVQALIGVVGQDAADTFDFLVCTPAWLAANVTEPLPAHGHLIVPTYDYHAIHAAIARLCDEATGPDWPAVAAQLGLHARWEYANHG